MKRLLLALLLTAVAGPLFAADPQPEAGRVHRALNADDFAAQAQAIRDQMEPGGRYEFVSPAERKILESVFAEIIDILGRHRTIGGMTDKELARVISAQDQANAILTHRDGERLVCANETRTGTHIPNINCQRFAELEQARRYTQDYMRESQMRATQSNGGEGGGGGGGGGGGN